LGMPDYVYKKVRYKMTPDSAYFFYYTDGVLYSVSKDPNSDGYFYTNDNGKAEWCK